jgi:hypothetical protein
MRTTERSPASPPANSGVKFSALPPMNVPPRKRSAIPKRNSTAMNWKIAEGLIPM